MVTPALPIRFKPCHFLFVTIKFESDIPRPMRYPKRPDRHWLSSYGQARHTQNNPDSYWTRETISVSDVWQRSLVEEVSCMGHTYFSSAVWNSSIAGQPVLFRQLL